MILSLTANRGHIFALVNQPFAPSTKPIGLRVAVNHRLSPENVDAIVTSGVVAIDAVTATILLRLFAFGRRHFAAHGEVGGHVVRVPANPTISSFSSNANRLILIGQVKSAIEVVGLHNVRGWAVIILSAALRWQKIRVATVLGDFDGPFAILGVVAQLEGQLVAGVRSVHVH